MKRFISGVIVGVCVGVFFTTKNSQTKMAVPDEVVSQNETVTEFRRDSSKVEPNANVKEIGSVKTRKSEVVLSVLPPSTPESEVVTNLNETSDVRTLDLDISEEQITEMEQHFSDLQKDVSLFRDSNGWVVRFHNKNNLLSSVGIKDNDFIRFGQIQKLKEDHSKGELISRLEAVMVNLQR